MPRGILRDPSNQFVTFSGFEDVPWNVDVIEGFSNTFLRRHFDQPVPIPWFHKEWWELCTGKHKHVAIASPRNSAKSSAITHTLAVASMCLRKKTNILLVSDTYRQAIDFVKDIRLEFETNDELQQAFPHNFVKWPEDELEIRFADGHHARIYARGSTQNLRGTKWHRQRPNWIVLDDLENDEICYNKDSRRKFKEWFYEQLLPCGSVLCDITLIGTILHEDSLLNNLMPREGALTTVETPLKRSSSKLINGWQSVLYRAHPDLHDFSEVLWPDKWPAEALREKRDMYIAQGMKDSYVQEYLNNPFADDNSYFRGADLLPIPDEEKDPAMRSPEQYFIGVDLAIATKQSNDFSVFVVCGVSPDNTIRVREVVRERLDGLEIIETMFTLHQKYSQTPGKPWIQDEPTFLIESESISRAIGSFLNEEMSKRNQYLFIHEMTPSKDKQTRARSIQARVRSHTVEFDHDADWWSTVYNEFTKFPRGRNDDTVDALAYVGQALNLTGATKTYEEVEEENYLIELEEAEWEEESAGRSRWTGY